MSCFRSWSSAIRGGTSAFILAILFLGTARTLADELPGTWSNGKVTLTVQVDAAGKYTGTVRLGDNDLPFVAHRDAARPALAGTFQNGGHTFDFTATLADGAMTFATGQFTAALKNAAAAPDAAVNPFDALAGDKPAGNPIAVKAPQGGLAFTRQPLFDPFAQTNVLTVLVPDGWQLSGHANWNLVSARMCDVDLTIFDPKTGARLVMYPQLLYHDNYEQRLRMMTGTVGPMKAKEIADKMEGRDFLPGEPFLRQIASPRDYMRQVFLPQFRKDIAGAPDVKFGDETDLPDVAKTKVAAMAAASPNMHGFKCRASRFLVTYTNADGKPTEEQFTCLLPSFPVEVGNGAFTGWQSNVSSSSAPVGVLEHVLPLLTTVESSIKGEVPWAMFAFQMGNALLKAKIDAIRQANSGQPGAQPLDDNAEHWKRMADIARDGAAHTAASQRRQFEDQMAAKDQAQHQFMNYVQDRKDYVNPRDNSTMTLPYGYKYNYVSNDGTSVIFTNDATYKPPVDPKTSWDLLQPAH